MMRTSFKKAADYIDALGLNERIGIMIASVLVIFMFWDLLLMQPLDRRQTVLDTQIAEINERVGKLSANLRAIAAKQGDDPNQRLAERRQRLQNSIAALDKQLEEQTADLITPPQMAVALEQVLAKQQKLKLIDMQSLAARPVFEIEEAVNNRGNVYQHGLEMTLEGRYLDLLNYLRAVEALPYTFFWEALDIETVDYPTTRIKLRVYTLSLDEEWIGV